VTAGRSAAPGDASRPGLVGDGRAVVTGGAGFIGSHLVRRLQSDGWSVLVVDDLSTGRSDRLPAGVTLDVRDISADDLEAPFRSWRPDAVFHLAAQSSVPASHADPLRDLAVNVVGTHRVTEATRAAGASALVFVSSGGAVYGETPRAATEETLPAPASYYGVHKLAAEGHVAVSGVPHAIVRPANVYGPGQTAGVDGAVIASFLDQAAAGGPLRIHGDGGQSRDFVQVQDAVAALVLVARLRAEGGGDAIWNVATGTAVTIRALADAVEAATGRTFDRLSLPRRSGDVTRSLLSPARLRSAGWRPSIGLEDGLRGLIDAVRDPEIGAG
jgi:UDP-glucose 4-epimerase